MDWSMPDDYWRTTWHHWLPEGPWMMLAMAVGTATHRNIDGSLQEVLDTICEEQDAELPRCGPLNGPLRWKDPSDPEGDDEAEQAERNFAELLALAGRTMPTTNQELADLLAELGVLVHTTDPERWRLTRPLPLISETLPLPEGHRAHEQWIRDYWDYRDANQAVLQWTIANVPDQERIGQAPATLGQLAAECELTLEETRYGLALMDGQSDVTVLRHDAPLDREQIFALKDHQRFQIRMDWDEYAESRITIMRAPGEEELQEV
ncbi:DUF6042 family protein [Nocardiopsis sp. NPDC057823]|uniref:DUF6042 family protein n=1 Tax=Nocardiopsis sp. NPDC057823 TaxID=3346256 RepID=UPI00366C5227